MSTLKFKSVSVTKAVRAVAALLIAGSLFSCGNSNKSNTSNGLNPDGSYNPNNPYGQNYPGGCIPLGQPITFRATNMYMDYANIVGGRVPYSGQNGGEIIMGGGGAGPFSSQSTQHVSISMNISGQVGSTTLPYQGYPNQSMFGQTQWNQNNQNYPYGYNGYNQGSNRVQAAGVIQLSQTVIQAIQAQVYSGQIPLNGVQTGVQTGIPSSNYPYNNYQNNGYPNQQSNICISGIALNIGRYNNRLYSGNIFLYLNGTTSGYRTGIY